MPPIPVLRRVGISRRFVESLPDQPLTFAASSRASAALTGSSIITRSGAPKPARSRNFYESDALALFVADLALDLARTRRRRITHRFSRSHSSRTALTDSHSIFAGSPRAGSVTSTMMSSGYSSSTDATATVNVAASTAPALGRAEEQAHPLRHQLTLLARRLQASTGGGRLQLRQGWCFFRTSLRNRVEQAADQRNRVFGAELASAADRVEQPTGVVSNVAQPFPDHRSPLAFGTPIAASWSSPSAQRRSTGSIGYSGAAASSEQSEGKVDFLWGCGDILFVRPVLGIRSVRDVRRLSGLSADVADIRSNALRSRSLFPSVTKADRLSPDFHRGSGRPSPTAQYGHAANLLRNHSNAPAVIALVHCGAKLFG